MMGDVNGSASAGVNARQAGALVASLGGLLLLAAWFLGTTQVTFDATDCGTALGGDSHDAWITSTATRDACASKLDARQAVVWTLGGVGVGVVVLGLIAARTSPSERHDG